LGETATLPIDFGEEANAVRRAGGRALIYKKGLVGTFKQIIVQEGLLGLYRGIVPEYYKSFPVLALCL
jgi:solute carrier family 25 phosphate transporter 23/24/25/41